MSSEQQPYGASNALASTSKISTDPDPASIMEEEPSASLVENTPETDLISTIESDLTLLIQIMSSSISYISNRSAHVQLSKDIPLYNPTGAGQLMASKFLVNEADMMDSIEELTSDLVGKAKDIEGLVGQLPKERDDEEYEQEMSRIQSQVAGVNQQYRAALVEASELKSELDTLLHDLCDNYQKARAKLADAARKDNLPTTKHSSSLY